MKDLFVSKDFTSGVEIKDIDGKKGIVAGYFANFNSLDSDGDIIVPGAFSKTIKENGPESQKPRIKHLLNHDITQPLGVIISLKEDTVGLYYESKVGSHSLGQDFIKMVESGLVTEHSIGFRTVKNDKKNDANYLTELRLWEGSSLTAWGANGNTPLTGMKGLTKEQAREIYLKKSEAIDKFCRNTTATDETIEMLLLHNKQLTQLLIDQTTEPIDTLPGKKDETVKLSRTIECPNCHKQAINNDDMGYIRCHHCKAAFARGSKYFIVNS